MEKEEDLEKIDSAAKEQAKNAVETAENAEKQAEEAVEQIESAEKMENQVRELETLEAKKPTKSKSKAPLIAIIIILLAALIGVVVYLVISNINKPVEEAATEPAENSVSEQTEEKEEVVSQTEADKEKAVKTVVDELIKAMDEATSVTKNNFQYSLINFTKEYDQRRVAYKVENALAASFLEKEYDIKGEVKKETVEYVGSSATNQEITDRAITSMINKLEELGFVSYQDYALFHMAKYINNDTGVICSGYSAGDLLYVGCSHISWISEEKIALINALYEAFATSPTFLEADPDDIENSSYAPYQRITASQLGGYALLYRTSPEAKWQYLTGGNGAPQCSEFESNVDASRAFAGFSCYRGNGTTESAVTAQ